MNNKRTPRALRAMELLKDPRLTNKQIAIRCNVSERHMRGLRREMEVEK